MLTRCKNRWRSEGAEGADRPRRQSGELGVKNKGYKGHQALGGAKLQSAPGADNPRYATDENNVYTDAGGERETATESDEESGRGTV